ncbi:hypothetical protein [Paucibacter sp. B51]|uniref:hypothetical protein n=1 Tax=Paucibacter sp. B51 TaxID=2993315 RepID=UPI0022EBDD9D|nr:hypothetical protein [Paucibacter sp. B51]
MTEMISQGLQADGITISNSTLCMWFEGPRRRPCYQPVKTAPILQERVVAQVKVKRTLPFWCRTVSHLLVFNKTNLLPILQINGRQVLKRSIGFRLRILLLSLVAKVTDERLVTNM